MILITTGAAVADLALGIGAVDLNRYRVVTTSGTFESPCANTRDFNPALDDRRWDKLPMRPNEPSLAPPPIRAIAPYCMAAEKICETVCSLGHTSTTAPRATL